MHGTPVACRLVNLCVQLLTKPRLHLMWSCITEVFTRVWITADLNAGIVTCIMHANTNMPGLGVSRMWDQRKIGHIAVLLPMLVFVASYHRYHDHHNPDCHAEVAFLTLCSAGLWDAVLMAIHVARSTHRESHSPTNRLCQQDALLSWAACHRINAERRTYSAAAIFKLCISVCLP